MRSVLNLSLLLGLLVLSPATAAVLIPVTPPPGSKSMEVYDINDDNTIVGWYAGSDGVAHAFFGPLNGQYTTFGADYAVAKAINNAGYITGVVEDDSGLGIERYPNGSIHDITLGGAPLQGSDIQGINSGGVFVGNGNDADFQSHAFYGRKGKYRAEFTLPDGSTDPQPRGINDNGAVVGQTSNHGFLLQDGVEDIIDYPDPTTYSTFLQDVNNKGVIAGYWIDNNLFKERAFLFDGKSSTFVPIRVPHVLGAFAEGINNAGLVAISTNEGAFIYCPHSKNSGKCPAGGFEIADAKPIHVAPGKMLRYEHRPNRH
jgi:uncharacterized membrane protein